MNSVTQHHQGLILSRFRRLSAAAAAAVLALTAQPFPQSVFAAERPSEQLSLPVIALQTADGFGFIKDEYVDVSVSVWDENGTDDLTDTAALARLRGNSSRAAPKKSYKLHFPEKANPLETGDGKAKTWALIGNYFDATLLRNWTALQIGAKLDGLPFTPHCRSAELYIDGEYCGVFLLTEAVSVNKHRVHITEAADEVAGNGYLLEMTRYAQEPMFWADCYQFEVKSTLSENADTALEQVKYISDYTNAALHALQSGDQTAAEQYLDIPSLVDNCLVNEICKNVDVGWDSYYLAKDAGGRLTFHPVWDFDLAFGNAFLPYGFTAPEGENLFALSDSADDSNPWLCCAMRCPWFRDLLRARWQEMLPALRNVPAELLSEAEAHADAYERNIERLHNQISFLPGPDPTAFYGTHAAQVQLLADWIEARLDWLGAFYDSPEFSAGVFPDERGNALPLNNALAVSMLSEASDYKDCTDLCHTLYAPGETGYSRLLLAGGQTYRLSCECSGPAGAELVCTVSGAGDIPAAAFPLTAEPQTVEWTFTPENTTVEGYLSLVAEGGGTVRIEHLSLTAQYGGPVSGDLNRDGRCDAADVVLLRGWLLCMPDAVPADWHAGDLHKDGRLDARDFTLLKRAAGCGKTG